MRQSALTILAIGTVALALGCQSGEPASKEAPAPEEKPQAATAEQQPADPAPGAGEEHPCPYKQAMADKAAGEPECPMAKAARGAGEPECPFAKAKAEAAAAGECGGKAGAAGMCECPPDEPNCDCGKCPPDCECKGGDKPCKAGCKGDGNCDCKGQGGCQGKAAAEAPAAE